MKSPSSAPTRFKINFTNALNQPAFVAFLLTAVTLLLYFQVLHHDYVSYDDGDYVYENQMVQQGLTEESVQWAFTASHAANWHPLTWLSHMLDWELYGNQPGKHHFTSVLLHLMNSLLIFWGLRKMTGERALGPSALVAALFAWHPLHVESVAWLAERKDVLSTFFGLLALGSYMAYARLESGSENYRRNKTALYFLTGFMLACGLMSKPMLVTLPLVFLLLDYWPLQRTFNGKKTHSADEVAGSNHPVRHWLGLFAEKLPFLALSAVSSYITFQAQIGKTVQSLSNFSLHDRLANVLVTYVTYLKKMIWPENLAFFYPLVKAPPLWLAALSGVLLVGITTWLVIRRQRWPWAIIGWFWYLGTLVPVIGLVHVGEQSHADRYTYIPSLGIFLALVWGAVDCTKQKSLPEKALSTSENQAVPASFGGETWKAKAWAQCQEAGVTPEKFGGNPPFYFSAAIVLVIFSVLTWWQIGYWKNNRTLLQHAIAVTKQNFLAHNNYGVILANEGRYDEAIQHYEEALRWKPAYARAYDNWASALTMKNRLDEAVEKYQSAIQLNPHEARTRHNLAVTLARQKNYTEAIAQCHEALRLNPNYVAAYFDLALALHLTGKFDEAIAAFTKYLSDFPQDGPAHLHLASALSKKGNVAAAVRHYRESIRLQPEIITTYSHLAWILATHEDANLRNGGEAVKLAEHAAQATNYQHLFTQSVLAAAYAEAGRFAEAVATAQKAISLAEQAGRFDFVRLLQQQQHFYQVGQPLREKR